MYSLGMADWPFHLLAAEQGSIAYIDEAMAAYRIHMGGHWSSKPASYQAQEQLKALQCLGTHFNGRFAELIDEQIFVATLNCAVACAEEGNRSLARRYARACIRSRPHRRNLYRKCAIAARVYAPAWAFGLMKRTQLNLRRVA
jgi:hypothetical protein